MSAQNHFTSLSLCFVLFLSACSSTPSTEESPWGAEFKLISDLSPEFVGHSDGIYYENRQGKDGRIFTVGHGNLTYKCEGREQEYFEFARGGISEPPNLISNDKPSHLKQFNPSTFPEDLAKVFTDRSNASDRDAIKSLQLLEAKDWPPLGLADFISYDDGWLIAYDAGEFGGALIWLPKDGDSYFISNNNTQDLQQVGDVVYAAEGLDHLSLTEGGIRAIRRDQQGYRTYDKESGEIFFDPAPRWQGFREFYTAASAVKKVAARNGMIVGLTSHGLVVVSSEKIVQYNWPNYESSSNAIQRAQDLFVGENNIVYVAGVDMLGVYNISEYGLVPQLYARQDCRFDYGIKPRRP